jgi:hypothetical protein
VSAREYLIDASAYWRIDRGAVLAAAWREHLERGLVWICPPTELEICRRASKDQLRFTCVSSPVPMSRWSCITGPALRLVRSRLT